ncbi:phospholipid scramblase 2-like isoform X2 [Scyliorhinus canicula]|uniref:phospholipid scramblase 2-like isoform X2 n=1 Tax=Scyliorhinus canicula TaxID=7830 RepID=UPI0018F2F784|nr:phospholipid scramblase 2-like isoform X2 [Scyliorhinus canicula]
MLCTPWWICSKHWLTRDCASSNFLVFNSHEDHPEWLNNRCLHFPQSAHQGWNIFSRYKRHFGQLLIFNLFTMIEGFLIRQQLELVEALLGFEMNNKYEVKNKIGQQIYFAAESSNVCCKLICGSRRSLKIHIMDNMGTEVIRMRRPVRCTSCWCPCCLQKLEVQAPPGEPIGYIVQKWHPCLLKFVIQDENKAAVLKIRGPCCLSSCGHSINFKIKNLDESKTIGKIAKNWSGMLTEVLTDVDNFVVDFPMTLDVRIKTTLLGACFLIDFMYFEKRPR